MSAPVSAGADSERWFRKPFAVARGWFARKPKAEQPLPVPVPAQAPVDQPYIAYDHDSTFDPYDFLPVDVPSGPTPTPWYDDASREARWAALREASAAPESLEHTEPPEHTRLSDHTESSGHAEPSGHADEPEPPVAN